MLTDAQVVALSIGLGLLMVVYAIQVAKMAWRIYKKEESVKK